MNDSLIYLQNKYPSETWSILFDLFADIHELFLLCPNVNAMGLLLHTSTRFNDGDANHTETYAYVDGFNEGYVLGKDRKILDLYNEYNSSAPYSSSYKEEHHLALSILSRMRGAMYVLGPNIALRADRLPEGTIKFIMSDNFYIDED